MIPKKIGDYQLIEKIGSGGFGVVYKGQHIRLPNRFAAIKMFIRGGVDSNEEQAKFLQDEAHLLDTLHHPHILPVQDYGMYVDSLDVKIPYLITDLAPEGSLSQHIKNRENSLPFQQSLSILTQIGEALQFAHDHSIVHCDIKPENILFRDEHHIFLADFGIAVVLTSTRTKHGVFAGTLEYMAPEQFDGNVNEKSDQYSLACVAYELFTGSPPFWAKDRSKIMFQHLYKEPELPTNVQPQLPRTINTVLLQALAKDSDDRYPSIRAFVEALQDAFTPPRASISPSLSISTPVTRRRLTTRNRSIIQKRHDPPPALPRLYQIDDSLDESFVQIPVEDAPIIIPRRVQRPRQRPSRRVDRNMSRWPDPFLTDQRRIQRPVVRVRSAPPQRILIPSPHYRHPEPYYPQTPSDRPQRPAYLYGIFLPFCYFLISIILSIIFTGNFFFPFLIIACVCILFVSLSNPILHLFREQRIGWKIILGIMIGCLCTGVLLSFITVSLAPFFFFLFFFVLCCIIYRYKS